MKKIISSVLILSTTGFISAVQANDYSPINSLVSSHELAGTGMALDNLGSAPVHSTIILIVAGLVGLYFAKKHHEVAKKHQALFNKG